MNHCNPMGELACPVSPSFFEEGQMDEHWLWPVKGGTWKERLIGLIDVVEIALLAALLYRMAWVLAPYF